MLGATEMLLGDAIERMQSDVRTGRCGIVKEFAMPSTRSGLEKSASYHTRQKRSDTAKGRGRIRYSRVNLTGRCPAPGIDDPEQLALTRAQTFKFSR